MSASPEDAAYISPEDAAHSLHEIRAAQAKMVRARPWWPGWYTTGVALYVTGMQYCTEPGTTPAVQVTGITLLSLVLAGLVAAMALSSRQRPHRSLVTPAVLGAFGAWLLVGIALCMVLALALSGAGISYGRTYAGLAMTAYMAVTGPLVARWITRRMAATIERG
ncbi:hypothetical protein [Sphaerisporangium perillae]|uniref:hypothetical protein n=1 Tax=Sphaerisporangium perillae TaxID=2935860 RepID=UPI00200DF91F|nr:hypothetical protein [Sphaerisporangium perillae]